MVFIFSLLCKWWFSLNICRLVVFIVLIGIIKGLIMMLWVGMLKFVVCLMIFFVIVKCIFGFLEILVLLLEIVIIGMLYFLIKGRMILRCFFLLVIEFSNG